MEIVKYGVEISDSKLNVLVKENTYNYGSQFFNKPGSEADIRMTGKVTEAATLMGIKLFDHIIICKNGYVSLAEEGLIRK